MSAIQLAWIRFEITCSQPVSKSKLDGKKVGHFLLLNQ